MRAGKTRGYLIAGCRHFSTKRPVKKQSPYTFQNVQASFSYLFNGRSGTYPSQKAKPPAMSPFEKGEPTKTRQQISFKYLFDNSKPVPKENLRVSPAVANSNSSGQGEATTNASQSLGLRKGSENAATNQVTTLRYLFSGRDQQKQEQQTRGRGRKRDQSGKGVLRTSNDDLRHKNLLASIRYLFGNEQVPLQ